MNNVDSFDLSQQQPTVLIVDDVRINQEVLVELLHENYQIKVASNGVRALEIAQHSPCPDLILLDVMMPDMDGYEVCQRLKENPATADIPIIFVTAATDFESEVLGLQLGAVDYISKPFNPSIILLRVRNQILLRKSLQKLRLAATVFENTMEAIMITDSQSNIIDVNPSFSKISGYARAEVLGKNPRMFKSEIHDSTFYQTMWEEINTKGYWQGEIWDKHRGGGFYAKSVSITTIFNKEGKVDCYLALFSDITARKQYDDEIKRLSSSELFNAKQEAERANHAKSEFLASMSHELRTPMNAVLGFAQLLKSENLTADQHDSVEEILTAGHHLMDLISEVLDLAKIESEKLELKLEKINLTTVMRNCMTLVQPLTLKENITLIDKTMLCQATVIADTLHLKQVILNLMSNAIKYNRVGGSVTLYCSLINPETLRINVADTGQGLSASQILKLFQPFERLSAKNSNIEGTGIGLCISKKLIEAMNGTIGVDSTEGEGCCFWIEIPLAQTES